MLGTARCIGDGYLNEFNIIFEGKLTTPVAPLTTAHVYAGVGGALLMPTGQPTGPFGPSFEGTDTALAWRVGVGMDYQVAQNTWTGFKVGFQHTGSTEFATTLPGERFRIGSKQEVIFAFKSFDQSALLCREHAAQLYAVSSASIHLVQFLSRRAIAPALLRRRHVLLDPAAHGLHLRSCLGLGGGGDARPGCRERSASAWVSAAVGDALVSEAAAEAGAGSSGAGSLARGAGGETGSLGLIVGTGGCGTSEACGLGGAAFVEPAPSCVTVSSVDAPWKPTSTAVSAISAMAAMRACSGDMECWSGDYLRSARGASNNNANVAE